MIDLYVLTIYSYLFTHLFIHNIFSHSCIHLFTQTKLPNTPNTIVNSCSQLESKVSYNVFASQDTQPTNLTKEQIHIITHCQLCGYVVLC